MFPLGEVVGLGSVSDPIVWSAWEKTAEKNRGVGSRGGRERP